MNYKILTNPRFSNHFGQLFFLLIISVFSILPTKVEARVDTWTDADTSAFSQVEAYDVTLGGNYNYTNLYSVHGTQIQTPTTLSEWISALSIY